MQKGGRYRSLQVLVIRKRRDARDGLRSTQWWILKQGEYPTITLKMAMKLTYFMGGGVRF